MYRKVENNYKHTPNIMWYDMSVFSNLKEEIDFKLLSIKLWYCTSFKHCFKSQYYSIHVEDKVCTQLFLTVQKKKTA